MRNVPNRTFCFISLNYLQIIRKISPTAHDFVSFISFSTLLVFYCRWNRFMWYEQGTQFFMHMAARNKECYSQLADLGRNNWPLGVFLMMHDRRCPCTFRHVVGWLVAGQRRDKKLKFTHQDGSALRRWTARVWPGGHPSFHADRLFTWRKLHFGRTTAGRRLYTDRSWYFGSRTRSISYCELVNAGSLLTLTLTSLIESFCFSAYSNFVSVWIYLIFRFVYGLFGI